MFVNLKIAVLVSALFLFIAPEAIAAPINFNVDGVITRPNGTPLEETNVLFSIEIFSPTSQGKCLLYREGFNVDMTGSNGYFSIAVGNGSNSASPGYALDKVLGSEDTLTSLTGCTGAPTYAPGANDDRQLVITFTDTSGAHAFSAQDIKSVPFAVRAKTAETVAGFGSTLLLKADPAVNQAVHSNTALNQAQYDEFWRLITNPSSAYSTSSSAAGGDASGTLASLTIAKIQNVAVKPGVPADSSVLQYSSANSRWEPQILASGTVTSVTSTTGFITVATGTSTPALTANVGTAAGTLAAGDDARFTNARAPTGAAGGDLNGTYPNPGVAKIAGKSVVLTAPASGDFLKYDGTNFVNATVSTADATKLPLAGGTMSGAIDMSSQNLTNIGYITMATGKSLHLSNNAADPAGLTAADKGKVWFNSTSGQVKYWDGAAAQSLGVAGSGVQNFNGMTGTTQTLAIGTSGSAPAWNSATDTHTLNIPMASTAAVTAGLLSKTDYDAFTAKLGTASVFSGDVTGTSSTTSVDKIKGKAITPGAYAAGQTLRYDGTAWVNAVLGFADLGSKPTTLAGYGITDAQSSTLTNSTILVGNGSNVATAVTMSGDATLANTGTITLATVPITKGGTGVTSFAGDKVITTSAAGALQASSCGLGQVIGYSAGGAINCTTLTTGTVTSVTAGSGLNVGAGPGGSITATGTLNVDSATANTASKIVARDASGSFAAGAITNTSNILKGATSGTLTMAVPATVTSYSLTWPAAVGGAGAFLTTDASGNLSWGSPAAIADSSYAAKGAVQFLTDASTSGITVSSGVVNVNSGTGANQIVKLTATSKYPAVDGSLITNLDPTHLSAAVPIANGGTGQTTKTAAFDALSPNTTKGDLAVHNGTNNIRVPAGTDAYVLTADSAQVAGLKWAALPAAPVNASYAAKGIVQFNTDAATSGVSVAAGVATINFGTGANQLVKLDGSSKLPAVDGSALTNVSASTYTGLLAIANGGTNSATGLSNNKIMVSAGGSIMESAGLLNGQILIGGTGVAPAVANVTGSSGAVVTNGAGTIDISTNAVPTNTASKLVTRDASGNFAAGAITNTSNILKGATSGTLTMAVPATVTSYSLTWPAAVGGAGAFLTTDASGNLSWGSPAAIADSSYAAKGAVQFLTDASTSGITVSSGVVNVNSGTGANQIVKLTAASKYPAVDGSLITNLDPTHLSAAAPIANGGTGQTTKTAAFDALSPNTTKGDLEAHNGTNNVRLPAGTNNFVLTADSAQAAGVKWAAIDGSTISNLNAGNFASGTLPVARGGTAATTFASDSMVVANATGTGLISFNTCLLGDYLTFGASGNAVCGNSNAGGAFFNNGNFFGGTATLGPKDSQSLVFQTFNTARMTFLNTGEIGIGTPTPTGKLTVVDTTASTGSSTLFSNLTKTTSAPGATATAVSTNAVSGQAYFTGTGSSPSATNTGVSGTAENSSSGFIGTLRGLYSEASNLVTGTVTDAYGMVSMASNKGTGTLTRGTALFAQVNNIGGGTISNGYGLYTNTIAGTNKWSIYTNDATAPSYFAGNIGIGNTAPIEVLHVNGNEVVGQAPNIAPSTTASMITSDTVMLVTSTSGFPKSGTLLIDNEAISYTGTTSTTFTGLARGAYFTTPAGHTSSTPITNLLLNVVSSPTVNPRLVVTGTGNVGIATITPTQKLEVNGGVKLNTVTAKPTCNALNRGTFWVTQATTGTSDSVEACIKNAADAYVWQTLL